MFAALADGVTRIGNFASSADCASTVSCLRSLGVPITVDGPTVVVEGRGRDGLTESAEPLDCGNSGTTVRLLSGILAGQPFSTALSGDESLSRRPMNRIIGPLTEMGAEIDSNGGRLPMTIKGRRPLRAIGFEPTIASAQLKSAVLLAGLFADGTTRFVEKTPTRDHTERMLRWFGVDVGVGTTESGAVISVNGGSALKSRDYRVASDVSSAAFFLVAAACLEGSDLLIEDVGLNPTRTAIIDAVRRFGADLEISEVREECGEPVGSVRVRGRAGLGALNPRIDGAEIANLIDEIPVLAVLGSQAEGGLEVRDARELRVKESDRIAAVVENLRRMGAEVEEFEDGFRVERSRLHGARIDSFGDHRIAMAFSVAALLADGDTEISGSGCAAVSFPEFYDVLRSITDAE